MGEMVVWVRCVGEMVWVWFGWDVDGVGEMVWVPNTFTIVLTCELLS